MRQWQRMMMVAAVVALAATARAVDLEIKDQWAGVVREDAPKAQLPTAVQDKAAWEKLWKLLRGADAVPAVDFDKDLVIVTTVDGPNRGNVGKVTLDDKGNVSVLAMSTRMAGPGFGYVLVRVSKQGIKSVEGKALEQGKVSETKGAQGGAVAEPAK